MDIVLLKCDASYVTIEAADSGTLSLRATGIHYECPAKVLRMRVSVIMNIYFQQYLWVDSALEIFTTQKKSFFLNFSKDPRKLFLLELSHMG